MQQRDERRPLTVEDARRRKLDLEEMILNAINDFEAESGLGVERVDLRRVQYFGYPRETTVEVSLEVVL